MKPMGRYASVAATVVLFGAIPSAEAGEVLDRIIERGYITLNGEPDWRPYSFKDESGNYVGFDVDVANDVAKRLGVEPRRFERLLTWEQETGGHWDGAIDVSIGSMTPTAKRGENLDFPVIYTYAVGSLAVHRDNTEINAPADASGKRFGVLKAANYELYLRHDLTGIEKSPPVSYLINDPVIITYDTEAAPWDELEKWPNSSIDATINYLPVLMAEIQRGRSLRIVGQPLYYVPQAIAIEPGDPEFAVTLTDIVDAMHADGTLTAMSVKWFGVDLTRIP
jgi:polar amino acid transport system substrate-binding protein